MGRIIKLKDTGEKINSDFAYVVKEDGKPNKYFSSKENYEKWVANKKNRIKIIEVIYEYLGYDKKNKVPTIFFKRLKEWNELYDYEFILYSIKETLKYNTWIREKEFPSMIARVNYLCAVLQNEFPENVNKFKRKKHIEKLNEKSISEIDNTDFNIPSRNIETKPRALDILNELSRK